MEQRCIHCCADLLLQGPDGLLHPTVQPHLKKALLGMTTVPATACVFYCSRSRQHSPVTAPWHFDACSRQRLEHIVWLEHRHDVLQHFPSWDLGRCA